MRRLVVQGMHVVRGVMHRVLLMMGVGVRGRL